ncbi:hypothetical protein KGF56_003701 [Candida oxycetoniae]|uniref:Uncharacterized protein n=1 Tax=Candida oxycetoniae TaxID=497107 RepID=A0AAI9SVE3_9ASCO|nr:uncharacterized protein KGF56_003701 [Candida oxycetoniae]KAI3403544.2 hypothetical protein KGF56_003701 [Candida oxycetoniae]
MGNYTLAYLQNSNIPINCSVYSLTNGTIKLLEHYSQTWNNDSSLHEILPAYYITNCSISKLIELVTQEKSNSSFEDLSDLNQSPYNQKDNGDTFVALLFALCGSCVSCWMLSLLLYLNPKHKRKPCWLVKTWLVLVPYLLEVILLTVIWEWVFNIWILEKRFELMNVLGRRISCEDVIDFRDEESGKRQTNNRFTGWIMNRAAQKKCEIEERSEESLKDFTSDEQTDDWESLSRVMEEREGQGFESENDTADDYESWIQEEDDEEDWRERGTRCSTESN